MDEKTTTEAPVDAGGTIQGVQVNDQGQAVPEPEETEQAEAVEETTEQGQSDEPVEETKEETQKETSEQEQLEQFAKTKGLTLDGENAVKAAKMAMNAEKKMHEKTARASELERTMTSMSDESAQQTAEYTGQDPEVLKRIQRMEVKDSIRDFWDTHPEARQYEEAMSKIATESGLYGTPEAILKAAYAIARSGDTEAVKSQGKREALQSLAHKQQAAVPTGKAVTSSMATAAITPENVDRLVAQNDQKWFEKHYDEINKAMAA